MRRIVPIAPHHVTRRNAEGYLKSGAEMRALFAERPDLCDRTLEIAERCTFDLGIGSVHFPDFPTPRGRSAGSVLAERCWRGMEDRGEDVYGAILARHGEDRCACVNMVDTFRARGAIREVGKALGLPEGEIDLAAKAFPHVGAHHVRAAMETLPELADSNLNAGQLDLLFR